MAVEQDNPAKSHETTPLLPQEAGEVLQFRHGKSVLYRALICSFVVSLSFGVTQVPLLYAFRLMTCEAYFSDPAHLPPSDPSLDHCSNREVEASTARSFAVLGASTAIFGVLNLFVTGANIKKFGIKSALLSSVFWAAVRLAIQNIGIMVGANAGIFIVQASQIITILGGPSGYLLALNSYVAEIIDEKERTGALGKLQGWMFLGNASAYLVGGMVSHSCCLFEISDAFGIRAPFQVTLILFCLSCLYVILLLPRIPLSEKAAKKASNSISKFFGPFRIFKPQKWIRPGGHVKREYGAIFLALGVFLGVLATGYIGILLQMYASDEYNFSATKNGYLISLNSFVRGLFLTLVFPRTILAGRKWTNAKKLGGQKDVAIDALEDSVTPDISQQPNEFASERASEEPTEPPKLEDARETFAFDLSYARYSLLVDAIITGSASFISQGWQLYLLGVILPFASGTGAAAKGTILQMCQPSEKGDALSAITLVEMTARLATTGGFGLVYAALAEIDKTRLVFCCNAIVAIVGFVVLQFSHFPQDGSRRLKDEPASEEVERT